MKVTEIVTPRITEGTSAGGRMSCLGSGGRARPPSPPLPLPGPLPAPLPEPFPDPVPDPVPVPVPDPAPVPAPAPAPLAAPAGGTVSGWTAKTGDEGGGGGGGTSIGGFTAGVGTGTGGVTTARGVGTAAAASAGRATIWIRPPPPPPPPALPAVGSPALTSYSRLRPGATRMRPASSSRWRTRATSALHRERRDEGTPSPIGSRGTYRAGRIERGNGLVIVYRRRLGPGKRFLGSGPPRCRWCRKHASRWHPAIQEAPGLWASEKRPSRNDPASSISQSNPGQALGVNPMTWTPAPRTMSEALIQS